MILGIICAMRQAELYEKKDKGAVRCLACAHYCYIAQNTSGICGVRYNADGELNLAVFNRPMAVNIDSIEKKPLYHFLPGTQIFSLGTVGCNFGCDFCQNWDMSQITKGKEPDTIKQLSGRLAEEWPPERVVQYCLDNKIPSIAYTYNEPTIFAEYLHAIAVLAKAKGVKNVMVSNGYQSKESLDYLAPVVDAINIDLKSWSTDFYLQVCKAKLSVVKENIRLWKEKGVWVELTTLLIPGQNDNMADLLEMAKFIASVDTTIPWHISRFYPTYKMADIEVTPLQKLLEAYEIGRGVGLKYVYVGNTPATEYEYTICSKCGEKLIKRANMQTTKNYTVDGACYKCGTVIEGIWR